jgi:hypothetical protein
MLHRTREPITNLAGTTAATTYRLVAGRTVASKPPAPKTRRTTQAQATQRARIAQAIAIWTQITTAGDEPAWLALAIANPIKNRFGYPITLSAFSIYLSVALNLIRIATTPPLIAPADLIHPEPAGIVVTATASPFHLSLSPAPLGLSADDVPIVGAGRALSPGATKPPKNIPDLAQETAGSIGPFDITTQYQAAFGTPTLNQKIPLRIYYIRSTNGARSRNLDLLATLT